MRMKLAQRSSSSSSNNNSVIELGIDMKSIEQFTEKKL